MLHVACYVKLIHVEDDNVETRYFSGSSNELLGLVTTNRYDTISGEKVRCRYFGCFVCSMKLRAFV
jgi:hypothetical protein